MKNAKNMKSISPFIPDEKSKVSSGQVNQTQRKRSFFEYLAEVEEQIDIESFGDDIELARRFAKIIADVMRLPEKSLVSIGKIDMPAYQVVEIFEQLEYEHIEEAIRKYSEKPHKITNFISYVRTTLYNTYFELDLRLDNEVRVNMYGG